MKVQELIDELQKLDKTLPVRMERFTAWSEIEPLVDFDIEVRDGVVVLSK